MINGYTADFLEFYEKNGAYPGYPLKKAKMRGQRTWTKLKRQKILPGVAELQAAVVNQIKERELKVSKNEWVPADWPHPGTWLNDCRWEDECELPNQQKVLTAEEKWLKRVGKA